MLERGVAALMLASFFQGARCARPYSQDFVHPLVGRARSAPSHRGRWWRSLICRRRKGVGDRSKGDVVGTPVVPRRPLPTHTLRSFALPRSPSYNVPRPPATIGVQPRTQVPAPVVPSGRPSRSGAPRRSAPPLSDMITTHVDLAESRGAYPYLRPVLDRFGDQCTARLRGVLDCVSGWVRAADPCSVKAHQRGSRSGTAAELRRARDELAQAEAGRRRLRRELDAMVG